MTLLIVTAAPQLKAQAGWPGYWEGITIGICRGFPVGTATNTAHPLDQLYFDSPKAKLKAQFGPPSSDVHTDAVTPGTLYGTTSADGDGYGTVFSVNPDGTDYTVLHDFTGGSDGNYPAAGLVLSSNTLYGTTINGGKNDEGVVFAVDTSGSNFFVLHQFTARNSPLYTNSDGGNPYCQLVLSNNMLYGTTSDGGSGNSGTVFSINLINTNFTVLHDFTRTAEDANFNLTNSDGADAHARLLLAGNTLYGTTTGGGTGGSGTVFAIDLANTNFTVLHSFAEPNFLTLTNSDGVSPYGGLILSSNTLYGTTERGGPNPNLGSTLGGTVFALDTDGTFTNLYSFTGGSDGGSPHGELLLFSNILFGTTSAGGDNSLNNGGNGTVFGLNTDGTSFTVLHAFSAGNYGYDLSGDSVLTNSEGASPTTGLIAVNGNSLYGTANFGGAGGSGTVFYLTNTNIVVPLAVDTASLPNGTAGAAYNQALSASDGQSPYTWTNLSGNLPPGLALTADGTISGIPTNSGTFNFTVQVTDSASATATQSLALTISPAETVPPTISITSPTANQRWSNSVFTVTGKAADNVAVASVLVSSDGVWTNATLSNNNSNWTQQVSLIPGTNTITAYAVDTSGNHSVTNTVKLVYIVTATLTVGTNGGGGISPPDNGATLVIGNNYELTAKADKGFAFTNWTDGNGNVLTNGLTLKFVMASNLTFVANFVDITPPTLTITAPKTGAKWSNVVYTVTGTATDNVAVSNVLYAVNGGPPATATLSNTTWNVQVTLVPGTNTITAYAVGTSGVHSVTNTVKLDYILSAQVTVNIVGEGTIKTDYNGDFLAISNLYMMTATPAKGFAFTNWTDGNGNVLTNGATLKFVMASNLTFVANFVDITPPALTITAPKIGAKWSNAVYSVIGTATDNVAVSNVWISVNGGDPATANLTNTAWGAQVNLLPGTNSISAYAVDDSGIRSKTNTVSLLYVVLTPLTLTITNGEGTVSGAANGQELDENVNYTLDSKAGTGFAFEYWSGGVAMTANAKLTFTMTPGLAIIANFKDVTAPTLVITAPKANEKYSNATITVTGTAADNYLLGAVYVQINGGGWNLATGTTSWSASLPVVSGANLVQAYAVDDAGNISKTNSVSFIGVLPPDWAPASLEGKVVDVTPNGGNTIMVGFAAATFSQTDTNSLGDSGTGTYDYTQTATNVADLSMTFVLPLLLAHGEGAIQLDYTNANEGTFTNFTSGDYGVFAVAFTTSNLPASWSGHTFSITNYSDKLTMVKITSSTQVTVTDSDGTITTNTYAVQVASPIAAMITVTNTTTSKVSYFQPTFTSKSDGVYEVNNYVSGVFSDGDSGTFGFK
ncbi:MAG TPA: choice-of-anchor tandem repeat GloVer-containing protein [Candidatus Sulfotelmatobacter sp.]|nr:choice-of-anchor tandem repeat GloVer-containing protein [Candidatus Sulfotelmatobacter sp.]